MTGQKHPLRCETCNHNAGESKERYGVCNVSGEQITKTSNYLISCVGCASHSDARSADDVLALISDWKDEWYPETGTRNVMEDHAIKDLDRRLTELRKGGRE